MDTKTPAPVPYSLDHLTDDDLHSSTRRLVGRTNQLLAALLAHLAEVEARGVHRERACASLCTYCIYELRLSEDEAFRRARASKIARQFPILFEQVAAGEIHLTGILLLGPHLTEENHRELLARAKHRTKKEIQRLVRRLNPLPDVPARIEPLGPPPRALAANPSWSQRVEAHSPEVRELDPGDRPKDWADDPPVDDGGVADDLASVQSEPDPEPSPPDPVEPQRYKVQFTATQEYVDLLEAARDLLAHAVPSRSIEEVHLRAMRALVAELERKRTGATKEPQSDRPEALAGGGPPTTRSNHTTPRQRGARDQVNPRQRGCRDRANPRQRGRSVPRAVRRAVWKRDGARCSYVDASGQRCRETGCLELDHVDPHARGGPPTVENLRLRCRSHNALTAEYEFGRDFMASKIGAER
jgi:5-methylcytosine-specific restriction endonuclease McrA